MLKRSLFVTLNSCIVYLLRFGDSSAKGHFGGLHTELSLHDGLEKGPLLRRARRGRKRAPVVHDGRDGAKKPTLLRGPHFGKLTVRPRALGPRCSSAKGHFGQFGQWLREPGKALTGTLAGRGNIL